MINLYIWAAVLCQCYGVENGIFCLTARIRPSWAEAVSKWLAKQLVPWICDDIPSPSPFSFLISPRFWGRIFCSNVTWCCEIDVGDTRCLLRDELWLNQWPTLVVVQLRVVMETVWPSSIYKEELYGFFAPSVIMPDLYGHCVLVMMNRVYSWCGLDEAAINTHW